MSTCPPERPLLLRVTEAADALSLSRSTLYELIGQGKIQAVHVGRSVRITRAELERFVARLGNGDDGEDGAGKNP